MNIEEIDKYKMQITLFIKELFEHFPDIEAVDLIVKNIEKKDVFGNISNQYYLYILPFISLEKVQQDLDVTFTQDISFVSFLYENSNNSNNIFEKNKLIVDWKDLELNYDNIVFDNKRIEITDIDNNIYKFDKFYDKFLNFRILKDKEFLEKLFEKDLFSKKISHRFINGDTMSFYNFLGSKATAILTKLQIEEVLKDVHNEPHLNPKKFKI